MSGRGKTKAKIHVAKPELPPFLQRMKEQIVLNEDVSRKEQSERKRKNRPGRVGDGEDDPTVIRLNDDDLTEEEYKRLKKEMETQYKLDDDESKKPFELNIDDLIEDNLDDKKAKVDKVTNVKDCNKSASTSSSNENKSAKRATKKLSYGTSSDDDEDD